jgi:phage repressor protein C with HTH and peptisase S24 domain
MSLLISTHTAQYAVLAADLVGRGELPIGVLLHDAASDALYVRLRRDLEKIADEEEFEVLSLLEKDLGAKARELGAGKLLEWLEENASLSVRVAGRESVLVENFPRAVNRLYRQHVQSEVRQFQTHLPRYSLQVAAGKFLENEEVTEQGWEEAPPDLRIVPEMFVAQIVGHSMEPLIPDGSLCVFRLGVTGSRSGRLVLVENLETGGNDRYTVKRYKSEKSSDAGQWKHTRIRLESLNPGYPSWDLLPDEEKYRIVAEFVRVLD